ncbi:hypothetical protein CYMTET_31265 [Cymbomonas tetramitiformis]|uniref:Uncharacterized protein n=1 Tax=Cymbomonas tetramitiformis TaxID=36881 RepID=A0AAE0FHB7_9CHLO|nr:hypothetical protein CYMTET_31265 [Cymbomonas tetramitiformis]
MNPKVTATFTCPTVPSTSEISVGGELMELESLYLPTEWQLKANGVKTNESGTSLSPTKTELCGLKDIILKGRKLAGRGKRFPNRILTSKKAWIQMMSLRLLKNLVLQVLRRCPVGIAIVSVTRHLIWFSRAGSIRATGWRIEHIVVRRTPREFGLVVAYKTTQAGVATFRVIDLTMLEVF